jgi:hypothetical protein
MKKIITSIALLGLAVLTSCSGDSPRAQAVPTVVPDTYAITSLTPSSSSPLVNNAIQIDAVVTQNGSSAADGTTVEFTGSGLLCNDGSGNLCAGFGSGAGDSASVSTQGGVASAFFQAIEAGTYTIQAQVQGSTRQVSVTYRNPSTDNTLEVFQPLVPNIGSYDGGETVVINGKGIVAPAEVNFIVQGVSYPAPVQQVSGSKAGTGSITVLSPYIGSAEVRAEDREADVQVTVALGSSDQQQVVAPRAFTYLASATGVSSPQIFGVVPDTGRSSGGETVTVLGRNFVPGATTVRFYGPGFDVFSPSVTVAPDGLQMDVVTPRFSLTPLDQTLVASIDVNTPAGTFTLNNAFLVLADEPQPVIASFSPIAGPIDGGTVVTIFGSGFDVPVQVTFGALAATDVNVFDDQSIADNDRITCVAPDYSQQGQTPPVGVNLTVTNMETGKFASRGTFTYGELLYVTGNSPAEGRPGELVVIYGSGFEDPLQVFFTADDIALEVIDVSGTQILVKFPEELDGECSDVRGEFRVELLESQRNAQGGDFTLLGNQPRITHVEPVFVDGDEDIVIFGAHFADDVIVTIAGVTIPSSDVTVVSPTQIEVENIPTPQGNIGIADFVLEWQQTECVTGGIQGLRNTDTPVEVTVTNFPGSCDDSLTGGLIYQPLDTTCVVPTPTPTPTPTETPVPPTPTETPVPPTPTPTTPP